MDVRPGGAEDRRELEEFLRRNNALHAARRGELVSSLDQPTFVARSEGEVVGVATYVVGDGDCELLTLHATSRYAGIGSALVTAVVGAARAAGCSLLWVVTTNDNVDALRFYQRRGFRLARIRPGAVDESRRRLKPGIPTIGDHGIPLRDELELEMELA